jgi:hypothetical protein
VLSALKNFIGRTSKKTETFHGVLSLCSLVKELAVLQLLTEPLKEIQRLIESNRHGNF